MDDKRKPDGIVLTEAQRTSRRQRSIAIALALGVLVVLFFAVTMVKGPARTGAADVIDMTNRPTTREEPTASRKASRRALTRDAAIASICGFVVVLMVGAAYAAVPFYNWFCRATGFNGTTQVATSAPTGAPLSRKIAVRFDANVAPGLPWKFEPEQTEIEVNIGQVVTVFYAVTNQSARSTTALAAYNVAPLTVGAYFQKINCFCFTEQTMARGREARDARGVLCRSGAGRGP